MLILDRSPSSIGEQRYGGRLSLRVLAAALSLLLLFASMSPAWALAGEADSEGEGSAPPGLPIAPGSPGFDPGGEEAVLEDQVPLPGEEVEEAPVPEAEAPLPEPVPPVELPTPEAVVEPEAPPVDPPPTIPVPAYEGEAGPDYEAEEPPVVVQSESIAAPPAERSDSQLAPNPTQAPPGEPPASPSPEASEPAVEEAVPPSGDPPAAPGRPVGADVHVVRPGESLWSIATGLLSPGADDARIAAEVERLWLLNRERIGSGDPDLIYVGTVLRLR